MIGVSGPAFAFAAAPNEDAAPNDEGCTDNGAGAGACAAGAAVAAVAPWLCAAAHCVLHF